MHILFNSLSTVKELVFVLNIQLQRFSCLCMFNFSYTVQLASVSAFAESVLLVSEAVGEDSFSGSSRKGNRWWTSFSLSGL